MYRWVSKSGVKYTVLGTPKGKLSMNAVDQSNKKTPLDSEVSEFRGLVEEMDGDQVIDLAVMVSPHSDGLAEPFQARLAAVAGQAKKKRLQSY